MYVSCCCCLSFCNPIVVVVVVRFANNSIAITNFYAMAFNNCLQAWSTTLQMSTSTNTIIIIIIIITNVSVTIAIIWGMIEKKIGSINAKGVLLLLVLLLQYTIQRFFRSSHLRRAITRWHERIHFQFSLGKQYGFLITLCSAQRNSNFWPS